MTLNDELQKYVKDTFATSWSTRAGQKVPETSDIALGNDAVKIEEATILYADMADSTALVKAHSQEFAAEIYKNYLYCAAKLIRSCGGTITAYDGDRIMAVFIGDAPNTDAAKAALRIQYATAEIIQPALQKQYPSRTFILRQKVGIDRSSVLVARTGIRGSNDLVWVGNAANNAAKMAALDVGYYSYITKPVYDRLLDGSKYADGVDMWKNLGSSHLGYVIYGSRYRWGF